jgi:hypothetical protein
MGPQVPGQVQARAMLARSRASTNDAVRPFGARPYQYFDELFHYGH